MKHRFAIGLLVLAGAVFARQGVAKEVGIELPVLWTEHFEIHAEAEDARVLALQMEGRFAAYNAVFRFDPGRLDRPLRVRAFRDLERYESHVGARLAGEVPPGAVYLHFAQPELADQRELVIHLGREGDVLPFQAFVQFLRAFVPNPPIWLRDGFAIHFATLELDREGAATHRENLVWLDVVQDMPETPSPEAVMRALSPAEVENFPGLAWSLVSFFLNSGNDGYLRSLNESFMTLTYANTVEANTAAVFARITAWNDAAAIAGDHLIYVNSRRSFSRLVAEGQSAYAENRTEEAKAAFRGALEIRPDHYAPWYYLGLMAFNAGDTETAERYYRIALDFGADVASILYAMALNAATADRTDEAVELLRRTAEIAPDRFGERAETLIAQLESIARQ